MAGLRVGYAAAKPELIARMAPYRNDVISFVSARAMLAALDLGTKLIDERRAIIDRTRTELCSLRESKGIRYIKPQANFLMIETGRKASEMQSHAGEGSSDRAGLPGFGDDDPDLDRNRCRNG